MGFVFVFFVSMSVGASIRSSIKMRQLDEINASARTTYKECKNFHAMQEDAMKKQQQDESMHLFLHLEYERIVEQRAYEEWIIDKFENNT